MGEAAKRKSEIEALKSKNILWLKSLSKNERVVAEVAQSAFEKIVVERGMTEGCYNLAFFLHEHLRRKHAIETKIVIGWVNDGQWDGATSHAWVEYEGKKIDISIHKTSHPESQPSGDVIILDHVVKRGKVSYAYWQVLPDAAQKALERMRADSFELSAILAHKEAEHKKMLAFASSPDGVDEYFRYAPSGNKYEVLASGIF